MLSYLVNIYSLCLLRAVFGGHTRTLQIQVLMHPHVIHPPCGKGDTCVCVFDDTYYKITTTNYIFKTSLYITFHMYPWGLWPLKILMLALFVTCEIATDSWPWEKTGDDRYMLGMLLILISKSWGCPSLGPGMPFLNRTHAQRGGYLFLPGFSSLYDAIHGWMTGWMDGWKTSWKTTTTSFTICRWPGLSGQKNKHSTFSSVNYIFFHQTWNWNCDVTANFCPENGWVEPNDI